MKIRSRILATLRVINTIIDNLESREYIHYGDYRAKFKDYDRDMPDDYLIKLLSKAGLTKEDYPVIANILKSIALMTSGNLELIRYPQKGDFDPDNEDVWSTYFSRNKHLSILLRHLGIDLSEYVTRADYASAGKLLRVLGSSILDEKEVSEMFDHLGIEQEFGITQKVATGRKNLQIPKTLYRGLHSLSQRAYTKVTTIGYLWDIGKSVSTSMSKKPAEDFAEHRKRDKTRHSIVFVINNPKRQGFVIDNLSAHREKEVVLSGKLKVTWFATPKIGRPYAIIYVDLI